jgi:hypothetical protein
MPTPTGLGVWNRGPGSCRFRAPAYRIGEGLTAVGVLRLARALVRVWLRVRKLSIETAGLGLY